MSNHKNLVFFNKEGDYLNFQYNSFNERFEGDILFHENSTDTFKTYAIYTLENIPSFDFEVPGELTTRKFQLFNQYGFHFYSTNWKNQRITRVEPVNNDSEFYSKWIYGDSFDAKFPIGTIIQFDSPVLEFTNLTTTYVVVGSKPGAIMILSQMDNASFEQNYFASYDDPFISQISAPEPSVELFLNPQVKSISGLNAFGVYDYVDALGYNNRLSNWNEPEFYDKYYVGKKLNVVGSENNDDTFTVIDTNLTDAVHFEYSVAKSKLPKDSELIIEVITKTDVPRLYQGYLKIEGYKIFIDDFDNYPRTLKPGVEFKIVGGQNNNFYRVDNIPIFEQINTTYYFATQSQIIYEGRIYECVQAYTQNFGNSATAFITPENGAWWSPSLYIKVTDQLIDEELPFAQIYLTTDRYYYNYGFTSSSEATLAAAAEKYHEDLKIFNIDLFYFQNSLRADLMYSSKYALVNFYHTQIGPTYSIGNEKKTFERLVEVKEKLNYELNYNFSENKRVNIVFTDIDEFGIKVKINKMIYDEEAAILYTGAGIDMERTIDRTLRNWLSRWYLSLFRLGIEVELKYTGSLNSVFYNSILVKSTFPNVPLIVNEVQVGTTADYYIEHSKVLFNNLGPFLNIKINNRDYAQQTIFSSGNVPNISATLAAWEETHSEVLLERNIRVDAVNTLLKFNLSNLEGRLDYTITTGKLNLPGISDFTISKKLLGNEGVLVASNEVILPTSSEVSFEESGFATGMAFTINNTAYPFVNQDYAIQFLDPKIMNLSYQGPFWDLSEKACSLSGFMTLAFDMGFGQRDCVVPIAPTAATGGGGEFDPKMFDPTMFSIEFNPNGYTFNSYDLSGFPGTTNLVDLMYLELVSSIYGFGDSVIVLDAVFGSYIATIDLPGNTQSQSIEMEFNPVNSYIYCLSEDYMWIVDPTSNVLISSMTFSSKAYQMEVNPLNGDIYVSYKNASKIDIWYSNNLSASQSKTISLSSGSHRAMVFNDFEQDMYITGTNQVVRINGSDRTIQQTYGITGVTSSIFYEPVYEAIYVYGGSGLYKIDNGITQTIASASTYPFSDMIFNNLTGEMNISDSSLKFKRLDLVNDQFLEGNIGNYGYLALNQFDGDLYLSSQTFDSILVMNADTGQVNWSQSLSARSTKIIYNPERKSIWAIQPSINSFVEVKVDLNVSITQTVSTFSYVGENLYGNLDPNYVPRDSMWLKTRDYFRRPRENFEGETQTKLYWKWMTDQTPEFFIYDFSGINLPTTGPYAYTGEKPLPEIVLNRTANRDITKVDYSQYQQTVFDSLEYTLSYIDDDEDISVEAESLELFLGFKSEQGGALRSVLQLYKKEEVEFTLDCDELDNISFQTLTGGDKRGEIRLSESSSEIFTDKGFKPGQHILINVKDITNKKNQYISENNGMICIIRNVYTKLLVVDFFNQQFDFLESESGVITDYPQVGKTTKLRVKISVRDREIGRFFVYGQTEEEDERFKIELGNVGKLISPEEVFIFKEYDINEGGIDWKILNQKRKELLMNKHEIYPYIGSYKSLINAINYFGYNDLQLNEYYRNLDPKSENFDKLIKVEIPDIFDNTIKGWNERDFLIKDLPNDNFEATNLFNLTYFITDKEGNYILNYSLDEVIIKLQGLKYWLKRNIIPLTHKILDITGRAYFTGGSQIRHNVYDMRIFNIRENMTPITFKLNEAYLMPVNSGSTVYTCVLDLYTIAEGKGADKNPTGLIPPPKPYYLYKDNLNLPDTFDIKIRTYKIYKEWAPFKNYSKGEKVIYYEKLYESVKDNNKINDPRKYDAVPSWETGIRYDVATIVRWKRDYYTYSGLGDPESTLTPEFDPANWFRVTDWRELDYEPVQIITEFRNGDDLKPFNFTIDSNIDPFIVIEVNSHNGYGQTWGDRKNYQIKGLKDITEPYEDIEPIGPFVPIIPVY
jgi:hypothetical protein